MRQELRLYYAFAAAAGLAAAGLAWRGLEVLPGFDAAVLVAMYVGLNMLSVTLPSGMRITPGYPILVTGIVLYGSPVGMLAAAAGFLARMVVHRDKPLYTLYCIGQVSVSAYVAGLVRELAGRVVGPLVLPGGVMCFVAIALAFDVTNIGFASGRVTLEQGGSWLRRWLRGIFIERGWVLPVYHTLGLVSVLLAQAYGFWGLIVASLPPVGLHVFLRLHAEVAETRTAAVNDRLTGVGNFRGITQVLPRLFEQAAQHGKPLGAVWIDVDQLKSLNDVHGHEAGNEALRAVAGIIRANVRSTDEVARVGGDEFVVLLTNADSLAAQAVAKRVMAAVAAQPLTYLGQELSLSISAGAAATSGAAMRPEQLLDAADQAMYQVKRAKRARAASRAQGADGCGTPLQEPGRASPHQDAAAAETRSLRPLHLRSGSA